MMSYRCNRCGVTIGYRLRATLRDAAGGEQHFCSVECTVAWANLAGYYKPPADGVVDAEIMCGASNNGSDCRFTADHPGSHVSYHGASWVDNHALVWRLNQAVREAFAADEGTSDEPSIGIHYRGKAAGLQAAIDIVEGRHG